MPLYVSPSLNYWTYDLTLLGRQIIDLLDFKESYNIELNSVILIS